MFDSNHVPLAPRPVFLKRLSKSVGFALLLAGAGLVIGVVGYHFAAGLTWLDSFLNASMILGGMGPVNQITSAAGKVFAGCYALVSGLVLVGVTGLILGPIVHRALHKFHLDDIDYQAKRQGRG